MGMEQFLLRAGRSRSDRPAVALGEKTLWRYGELAARTARLAAAFQTRFGLQRGDRVALVMANRPEYLELLYACWHAGLAAVPVNAKLHPAEHRFILEHSGARLCFTDRHLATALAAELAALTPPPLLVDVAGPDYQALLRCDPAPAAETAPDDLAWLFYTSGTTGRPKGAMLSHRNLMAMTLCYFADVDAIDPDDCILHAAPLSHGSGLYGLPHLAAGACQVIPESGGFDPAEVFALLPHHPGLTLFAAPTIVKRLIQHSALAQADLRHLKTIVYGGGPMYLEDLLAAQGKLGNVLAQIYGQGESPMTITALSKREHGDRDHPRHLARLASAGKAQSAVEVRVAGEDGRALPPGELGEILVRGDSVMLGYWRNPEATAESLRSGWLHTGDLGLFDADGYLTLKDRSKDLIISGGANIYPREVEEVLLSHPSVLECAVVGQAHPEWGETVVAFVVPQPDRPLSIEELDSLCLSQIARFKRPRDYRLVDSLPKNNYGKVLKTELRRQLEASAPDNT